MFEIKKTNFCSVLIFTNLFFLQILVHGVLSTVVETDDTVIIDAEPEPEIEISMRSKRQFPFQLFPNWPSSFPTSRPAQTPPSCLSAAGKRDASLSETEPGHCVTLKQCFPVLYSLDDEQGDTLQNPGLAELLRDSAGSCDPTAAGNFFFFRGDSEAEFRQNFVCCSQNKKPSLFPTFRPASPPKVPAGGVKVPTQRPTAPPKVPAGGVKLPTRRPTVGLPRPPTAPTLAPKPPIQQGSSEMPKVDTSSSCGVSKVVGGTVSGKGRHPWIVALTNNGRQFCGGSLISKNFVLTAAHCVSHMRAADISRIRVHLGEHTLGVGENTEQFEKVTRVLYHRGFSHQTLHNDIALLKLESPARESSYIQPVCLSQGTRNLQDTVVTLAGWGQVQDGGVQSSTLREVNMKVWSLESCVAKYGNRSPAGIISSMICAGSPGKDACRGDSGGPLTMRTSRNVYEQVGVVSWGIGCGTYPGVYTKVSAFLPWIEKNRKL